MCLHGIQIEGLNRWNWDGDEIVQETIVPSSRAAVGSNREYDLDVRSYLATAHNAVLKRTLRHDVKEFLRDLEPTRFRRCWDLFQSGEPGAFDYRASVIPAFVAARIRYGKRHARENPWQFPEETLALRSGLCEDRAFLLASLLIAAGVSPYNVRVALGHVATTAPGHKTVRRDHMWVMYKNERGRWMLIEPLILRAKASAKSVTPRARRRTVGATQYVPEFLINDSHLWIVRHEEACGTLAHRHPLCKQWARLDPRFAGDVHQSILDHALRDVLAAQGRLDVLDDLKRQFFSHVLGNVVDNFDRGPYDPCQHFDNGYIDGDDPGTSGWALVRDRLAGFKSDNDKNRAAFASAAHAIADFYAHSSYLHFARLTSADPRDGFAEPYDPTAPTYASSPDYGAGSTFDLTTDHFSVNSKYFKSPRSKDAAKIRQVIAGWQGRLISGRYGQPGSGLFGWLTGDIGPGSFFSHQAPEILTHIPSRLLKAGDFWKRGALPHHNEIAVDEDPAKLSDSDIAAHGLYPDRATFTRQYQWRYNTACRHIRQAFCQSWGPGCG